MPHEFKFVWTVLFLIIFSYLYVRSFLADRYYRKMAEAAFHNKVTFVSAVADELSESISPHIKI